LAISILDFYKIRSDFTWNNIVVCLIPDSINFGIINFTKQDKYDNQYSISILTPWEANPYQLISWWEMERFSADTFYKIAGILNAIKLEFAKKDKNQNLPSIISENLRAGLIKKMENIQGECRKIALRHSVQKIGEFKEELTNKKNKITYQYIAVCINEIDHDIKIELKSHLFMYIPFQRAEFYPYIALEPLFGWDVQNKFPNMSEDISEAGKCFAVARYTACVFHLMRVMERTIQQLATKLGISFASAYDTEWQKIICDIRHQLKALYPKHTDPNRIKYESILGHLETIKIAWRNPTMHPKATYTEEEAKALLSAVEIFMNDLTKLF
jgi:hypothetical protein